jgi:hypothetical protein
MEPFMTVFMAIKSKIDDRVGSNYDCNIEPEL